MIQAMTTFFATPQRTAEALCKEPTPMMEPVMVWVVETGIPSPVAKKIVAALAVSAAKPLTGCSLVIFIPMVRTIQQPPHMVPRAMVRLQAMITHKGT